ncbi:LytTR family transcriptional regulator [Sporolactobacillus shoreae]|uniref:LytTR family transcriptional regulator n=1 Tax=Sporolactobacillus shoreae TaxID=1465501 RepID=A0A4Z0GNG0_9BACL|nr:LytTR family DNA-binding domain-containing protein [Sporolactobacillus shoreae]TGA97699.1 LytTR family transcriptional regulator [Sporolactobacillus shoreae]
MKLNMDIDPEIKEESVTVRARQITEEVEQIRRIVEEGGSITNIPVIKEDRQYILLLQHVSHVLTESGKTLAVSGKEKYVYKYSLKYFETHVDSGCFVRISKYCLANIAWMDYFEAGFSGNLLLNFKNGWKETVSRKYVAGLRKRLF